MDVLISVPTAEIRLIEQPQPGQPVQGNVAIAAVKVEAQPPIVYA